MESISKNSTDKEAEISHESIRFERNRVLDAGTFPRSPRLSMFFQFIVEEELAGRGGRINGTQIAIDVYGRDETFDPKIDPVVRVEARRLRWALESYYQNEGSTNLIHIEIPKGGYRPFFKMVSEIQKEIKNPITENIEERIDELPPVPDAPIVAVLPFRNLGGDSVHDYFAEGLASSLTTAITRFDVLQAIAEQSTIHYQGKNTDVRVVGRELGARFILEGNIQRSETTIRVTVTLSDASDGDELWAETFDRDLIASDLFTLEDELTQTVIAIVSDTNGIIPQVLSPLIHEKPAQELTSHEAVLRFNIYLSHARIEDFQPAKDALKTTVKREPDYIPAWSGLAILCARDYQRGFNKDKGLPKKAWELANHAVALSPKSAGAHLARAIAAFANRRADIVVKEGEKAIALNPNNASLGGMAGHLIGLSGELEKGINIIEGFKRLNPYYPSWFLSLTCFSHYMQDEYEKALNLAEQFTHDQWPGKSFYLAIIFGQLGRAEEASKQLNLLKEIEPDFTADPENYIYRKYLFDDQIQKVTVGLLNAGL